MTWRCGIRQKYTRFCIFSKSSTPGDRLNSNPRAAILISCKRIYIVPSSGDQCPISISRYSSSELLFTDCFTGCSIPSVRQNWNSRVVFEAISSGKGLYRSRKKDCHRLPQTESVLPAENTDFRPQKGEYPAHKQNGQIGLGSPQILPDFLSRFSSSSSSSSFLDDSPSTVNHN